MKTDSLRKKHSQPVILTAVTAFSAKIIFAGAIYMNPPEDFHENFLFLSNSYGQEFFRLNFEALEAYSACATSEEVSLYCNST